MPCERRERPPHLRDAMPRGVALPQCCRRIIQRLWRTKGKLLKRKGLAQIVGVSERNITDIIHEDVPHDGRTRGGSRPILNEAQQQTFVARVQAEGPIFQDMLPEIAKEVSGKDVCVTTCRNMLEKAGLRSYSTMSGPAFTVHHMSERMVSAQWIFDNLHEILFVDESAIDNRGGTPPRYWGTEPGLEYVPRTPRGAKTNAVGAVSVHGLEQLVCFNENINAVRYGRAIESILKDATHDGLRFLVQNGARYHWTGDVLDIIRAQNFEPIKLPPYSPDLNAIETFWAQLKTRMRSCRRERAGPSVRQLEQKLALEWGQLSTANTMTSFRGTLRAVVEANGGYSGG